MGDNKQWFKVWTSILTDPDMMALSLEDRGRWVTLGALTAQHGTKGVLKIKRSVLAHVLKIDNDDDNAMITKMITMPNVNYVQNDNGSCTVTFLRWHKYQLDSSGYKRLKEYRKRQMITVQEEEEEEKNKSKNKTKERKISKERKSLIEVPEWVPPDLWTGYLEMRKDRKFPCTEHALILAIESLQRLRDEGQDPVAILKQTIERGYRGFFPVNGKIQAHRGKTVQAGIQEWLKEREGGE